MTGSELKNTFTEWKINATQDARVLCLHTSKVSEYLSDVSSIPCSVSFHIEALNLLERTRREERIARRRQRKPHGG